MRMCCPELLKGILEMYSSTHREAAHIEKYYQELLKAYMIQKISVPCRPEILSLSQQLSSCKILSPGEKVLLSGDL